MHSSKCTLTALDLPSAHGYPLHMHTATRPLSSLPVVPGLLQVHARALDPSPSARVHLQPPPSVRPLGPFQAHTCTPRPSPSAHMRPGLLSKRTRAPVGHSPRRTPHFPSVSRRGPHGPCAPTPTAGSCTRTRTRTPSPRARGPPRGGGGGGSRRREKARRRAAGAGPPLTSRRRAAHVTPPPPLAG